MDAWLALCANPESCLEIKVLTIMDDMITHYTVFVKKKYRGWKG